MDNYNANGSGVNEDIFGFIPPDMMFQNESDPRFSSKEEKERYYYNREHQEEFHIKDEPPVDKTL